MELMMRCGSVPGSSRAAEHQTCWRTCNEKLGKKEDDDNWSCRVLGHRLAYEKNSGRDWMTRKWTRGLATLSQFWTETLSVVSIGKRSSSGKGILKGGHW